MTAPGRRPDAPTDAPPDGRVTLVTDGPVATVQLDRPAKLNALTMSMLDDLEACLAIVDQDPEVRAVVLASAGERAFCAGADIHHFRRLTPTGMWQLWTRRGHQVFDRLARLRQPTVAAMDGNAFGGGLEIALACDLRVLADDASVALTEVGLGTVPGWGGTQRLAALIGPARAKEMIFTARPVEAARCVSWGLVTQAVARPDVRASAHELALQIAAQAPVAVQMAKQAVDGGLGTAGLALESLAGAATGGTEDFTEGVGGFLDRRPPRFTGR